MLFLKIIQLFFLYFINILALVICTFCEELISKETWGLFTHTAPRAGGSTAIPKGWGVPSEPHGARTWREKEKSRNLGSPRARELLNNVSNIYKSNARTTRLET